MPFEKFEKGRRRGRIMKGPRVSLTDMRFYFNREAMEMLDYPRCIEYFWNSDSMQIGFRVSDNGYALSGHKTAGSYTSCCVAFKKAHGLEDVKKGMMSLVQEGDMFVISLEEEEGS